MRGANDLHPQLDLLQGWQRPGVGIDDLALEQLGIGEQIIGVHICLHLANHRCPHLAGRVVRPQDGVQALLDDGAHSHFIGIFVRDSWQRIFGICRSAINPLRSFAASASVFMLQLL
jgi:hypothetical protein